MLDDDAVHDIGHVVETVRSAGFEVTELEQTELPKAPPFVRPLIIGTATAPVAGG